MKEKFIKNLILKLNEENKLLRKSNRVLDIASIVSCVDQQIENYPNFIRDISKFEYLIEDYEDDKTNYTFGRIKVLIFKNKGKKVEKSDDIFWYIFEFYEEPCDYSDWFIPTFEIFKLELLGKSSWEGSQDEYLEYQKKFNTKFNDVVREAEIYKKEIMIMNLEDSIINLTKKLREIKKENEKLKKFPN